MGKYYQILLIDGWIAVVIQDFADLRLGSIPSEVNATSKGNLQWRYSPIKTTRTVQLLIPLNESCSFFYQCPALPPYGLIVSVVRTQLEYFHQYFKNLYIKKESFVQHKYPHYLRCPVSPGTTLSVMSYLKGSNK